LVLTFWSVFFIGVLGVLFKRAYVISLLLCLELLILSIFLVLCYFWVVCGVPTRYYCLVVLAVNACEARAGLALLVSVSRSYGNTRLARASILRS